jgi:phosphatidylserine/phosphatidylglycerophosphate/cardiolipin synthase-like enzyme
MIGGSIVSDEFQVSGKNKEALFTLKIHRGDGMALIAMNWKEGKPPKDFVGFAIEYKEPGGHKFFALKNRLSFPGVDLEGDPNAKSTRLSPIQKFRWVHFPRNAELEGKFVYKVTPVFMNEQDELSYGEPQQAPIELRRETYPKKLNVTFTRGFVASQAFVDKYGADSIPTLLPAKADDGLNFIAKHPQAKEALAWMGFEARSAILEALDEAIADKEAQVRAVVYDLNEPGIVSRFEKLGKRLKIIIDNDGAHGKPKSAESAAEKRLVASAGRENVKRQHMGKLQHNKTIVVDGPKAQAAVCGSTNHSWRGFFVQNNNAIILHGKKPVEIFMTCFNNYWKNDEVAGFSATGSATWNDFGLEGIEAQIGFSPRSKKNAVLKSIADDVEKTESSLFFSLAFLYQTPGAIQNAIKKIKKDKKVFSYGISDHAVKGLKEPETAGVDIQKPDGTVTVVQPGALKKNVPEPFKSEPTGGGGTRMHHKFIVIDFDTPDARVYMGSYNFSVAADTSNGENLLLIRDRRIAVSYVVEGVRLFDHYHFRVAQMEAKKARKKLQLVKPPRKPGEKTWWAEYYTNARKIRDRELFA